MYRLILGKCRERIKRHEGLNYRIYQCSSGDDTIGHGFNLTANKGVPEDAAKMWGYGFIHNKNGISDIQVEYLLTYSLEKTHRQLISIFGDDEFETMFYPLQVILMDMTFNMGIKGLLTFKKMMAAIYEKKINIVCLEIRDSKYYEDCTRIQNKLIDEGVPKHLTFHRAQENIDFLLKDKNIL
jgi:lysozyme